MAEWLTIEQWADCVRMERVGIVFELRNGDGQTLMTHCVVPLPEMPFDWETPPVEFRAVEEIAPRHSSPIPKPTDGP